LIIVSAADAEAPVGLQDAGWCRRLEADAFETRAGHSSAEIQSMKPFTRGQLGCVHASKAKDNALTASLFSSADIAT